MARLLSDLQHVLVTRPAALCVLRCRIQMLDMVRYLVVWNPLILVALHYLLHFLGLDNPLTVGTDFAPGGRNGTALNGLSGFNTSQLAAS
jgi:hypothetical protein